MRAPAVILITGFARWLIRRGGSPRAQKPGSLPAFFSLSLYLVRPPARSLLPPVRNFISRSRESTTEAETHPVSIRYVRRHRYLIVYPDDVPITLSHDPRRAYRRAPPRASRRDAVRSFTFLRTP